MSDGSVVFIRGRSGEWPLTTEERRLRLGREARETARTLRMHASVLDGLADQLDKAEPDMGKLAGMAYRQRTAIVAATTRTLAIWQKVECPEVRLD